MKKHLLLLLVLFAAEAGLLAQTTNQVDVNGKRQGYWTITALMKKLGSPWKPTQVVEEGNYANSMKTGMWIEYYQNGKKKSELTFVNNRANGPAKMYFENGQLSEEGNWVGTRWTGPYKLYYENGNLRQQFNYNNLGVRDGQQTYYHPNGKVSIDINMKAGKEDGWAKEYNTNGELLSETFYNGGVIDPSKTKTYEPKKPENPDSLKAPEELGKKEEGPIVTPGSGNDPNIGIFNGTGPWTLYKNGQITMVGTFVNWQLIDGEQRIYGSNGKVIRVKLYEGGKYVGDGPLPAESNGK